jgi:phosphate/sulfate permease
MKYASHDIGRILGLLGLFSGIREILESAAGMIFGIYRQQDIAFVLPLILGIALYNHRKWARVLMLSLSYLGILAAVVIGIIYPLYPSSVTSEISIRGQVIEDPALWKVYAVLVFAVLCGGLIAYFLRTEKARSEFGVA